MRSPRSIAGPLAFILRNRRLPIAICIALLCEAVLHVYNHRVSRPHSRLDAPFYEGCQDITRFEDAPRENATILMLARNEDVKGAVNSIQSLEEAFNAWAKYPITFLNDESWDQGFIDALSNVSSGHVEFGVIDEDMWGFPDWIDPAEALSSIAAQGKAGVLHANETSYHNMCRFNSGFFFDHPLLQRYKWYWRVEPNVRFSCRITYDPFVAMAAHKKQYGYITALWELDDTARSLFRAISTYKLQRRLPTLPLWLALQKPSYLPWPLRSLLMGSSWLPWSAHRNSEGDVWTRCHFWSNFEIASLDWFRSIEYRSLFHFLDEQGGFFFERWGDAPVHSLAAALLLDPSEVHHFADFGYVHEPYQYCAVVEQGEQGRKGEVPNLSKIPENRLRDLGCDCVCDDTLVPQPTCLNQIKGTVL